MRFALTIVATALAFAATTVSAAERASPAPEQQPQPVANHWSMLEKYCFDCHNATDWQITPLMAAAGVGSTTIDTRARFRNEQGCIETARALLTAGANVNAVRDNGQTALHGAALWGWNAFLQFLADNGADLRIADKHGLTPLDVAMGKSAGTGRFGLSPPEPRPETVALLQKLLAARS